MNRFTKLLALGAALSLLAACGTPSSAGPDAGAAAGADAATAAGADGSTTGGQDGSTAAGADASLPPPATFDVTIATSCPFAKCGGDLLGTWDYKSLCVSEAEVVAPLQTACSSATASSITAQGTGRVVFQATGFVSRKVSWSGTATVNLPASCTFGSCVTAQAALRKISGYETATCTGSSDCACTVPISGGTDQVDAYVVAGSTVKVNGHDYDYCASGSSLAYDDVTTPDGELGVAALEKR